MSSIRVRCCFSKNIQLRIICQCVWLSFINNDRVKLELVRQPNQNQLLFCRKISSFGLLLPSASLIVVGPRSYSCTSPFRSTECYKIICLRLSQLHLLPLQSHLCALLFVRTAFYKAVWTEDQDKLNLMATSDLSFKAFFKNPLTNLFKSSKWITLSGDSGSYSTQLTHPSSLPPH